MHGITKCTECKTIMSQCRCFNHREVTWDICIDCENKDEYLQEALATKFEPSVETGIPVVHNCSMCKGQLSENVYGQCDHCTVDCRNSIRNKLKNFFSDCSNWTYEEWKVLYEIKDKVLEF